MNGIEKITARIAADADREVAAICEKNAASVKEIRASFEEKAQAKSAGILQRADKTAAERETRIDNMAQMEAKKMILSAKQEMLDRAFDLALQKLMGLKEEEMVSLLASLAAKASVSGKERLIFNEAQKEAIGAKTVDAANRLLKENGRTAGLTLAQGTAPIGGGLLISDEDTEVNCAFETLVRLTRGEIAGQVAKELFA